jgi:hypothetical protein
MSSCLSFPGEDTSRETGKASKRSAGSGRRQGKTFTGAIGPGSSQRASWVESRMTGIRAWIGARSSFAEVVMMVHVGGASDVGPSPQPGEAERFPTLESDVKGLLALLPGHRLTRSERSSTVSSTRKAAR